MRKISAVVVVTLLLSVSTLKAVDGNGAMYVGGTITNIPEKTEGRLLTASEDKVSFVPKKGQATTEIPYSSITALEYGQKAGRRVAVAVMVSPLALFSKKRNHYLTINYKDTTGKEQAGVFELGKDVVRTTLKILEVRSGKQIEYQDEEARKSGVGGSK